jgi:hypothetical protein
MENIKKPIEDLETNEDFKEYDRKSTNTKYKTTVPILINKNNVAKINIFEKYNKLEEDWILKNYINNNCEFYDDAAKEFFSQLKIGCSVSFIENLILEFSKKLKEDKIKNYNFDELINIINK